MSNTTSTDRRAFRLPLRARLAAVSAAVLGLSMLLSVAPVLGANNGNGSGANGGTHGTSGNVKVNDAGTGVEASGSDNEPHVCSFWLGFTFDAPYEVGTWIVVSWAPTGDGTTVASGIYDTAGDGIDNSSVIELTAGHYRVEWSAIGATSSKKKTFWVDATCGEMAPVEEPAPLPDAPAAEESQSEEAAPPTDAPGSPADESDELVLSGEGTAPEDESQTEQSEPTDEEALATDEETPVTDEEPTTAYVIASVDPSDAEQPAQDEQPAQAQHPAATDPGAPPSQDELDSIGGVDEPMMADTATASAAAPNWPLAILGLLMLIAAHAARRDRTSDRDASVPEAAAPNA